MDDLEETQRLNILKKQAISRANKDVKQYVDENIDVLADVLNKLCDALDNRQSVVAGKLAYQLSTMALLYDRPDYENMADFLCKVLQNKDFTDVDGICDLFSSNFKYLSFSTSYKPDLEQKILIRTRESLAKFRT